MKTWIIILSVLFAVTVCGCSSDDDQQITGYWKLDRIEQPMSNVTYHVAKENIIIQFKKNGILLVPEYEYENEFTSFWNPGVFHYEIFRDESSFGNSDLISIDGDVYLLNYKGDELWIQKSYLDGSDFIFIKP